MKMDPNATYIFIGDVHGQAPTLRALLQKLGWKKRQGRLKPRNDEHLVFVGDLIDRGSHNLETVEIVRELVEQGDATCLMGNHEFNAVHFHTEHPSGSGQYLRDRSTDNLRQHGNVLDELTRRPGFLPDMLAWFKTLPVAIEGPGWRCVHACWHDESLNALTQIDNRWYLPADAWVAAATKDTAEYRACENLMKGPEYKLPDGSFFLDKEGVKRHHARIRWWSPQPDTLEEALLFQTPPEGLDTSRPYDNPAHPTYPAVAPPVFFGHYWNWGEPTPESHNAVCLDYSAGRGKHLVAYRLPTDSAVASEHYVQQAVVANPAA